MDVKVLPLFYETFSILSRLRLAFFIHGVRGERRRRDPPYSKRVSDTVYIIMYTFFVGDQRNVDVVLISLSPRALAARESCVSKTGRDGTLFITVNSNF